MNLRPVLFGTGHGLLDLAFGLIGVGLGLIGFFLRPLGDFQRLLELGAGCRHPCFRFLSHGVGLDCSRFGLLLPVEHEIVEDVGWRIECIQ